MVWGQFGVWSLRFKVRGLGVHGFSFVRATSGVCSRYTGYVLGDQI